MSIKKTGFLMSAAAAALIFGGATGAHAQYDAAPPAGAEAPQQFDVSNQQLEQFAEAEGNLRDIQEKYQAAAGDISSAEEMQNLQQQMNAEMVETIQTAGLSVEEYNYITGAIQNSPEVRQQYMSIAQ